MNILHLTDLHFSCEPIKEQSQEKWGETVRQIIEGCGKKKINILAITGDLTCHGMKEEFDRAECFIQAVLDGLSMTREQVIICPGNHDADTEKANSTFEQYDEFVQNFYKNIVPVKKTEAKIISKRTRKKLKFAFLTMNTCRETSLELYDRATIGKEDYKKLQELSEEEYGILLFHHQPEAIENQNVFINLIKSGKIKLILTGHQHMSQTRVYHAGDVVIVGGMAVTPHRTWMARGCQLVHVKADGRVKAIQINL